MARPNFRLGSLSPQGPAVPDTAALFVERIERAGVPYMVRHMGGPYSTGDPDVVLDLRAADAIRLRPLFSSREFYFPSDPVLADEAGTKQRGWFHLVHRPTGRRADVHIATDDPLFEWAFPRRERFEGEGTGVWFAPVEYAVLRALESHRETGSEVDAQRVAALVRSSRGVLDYVELGRLMGRLAREP